ncbi:MAG: hypothetical protein JW939_01515 [Candidatus Thermoplasmatota archaeon]|nr:hypothetical protein [Candidatus Thermoplasmatota archaeon]
MKWNEAIAIAVAVMMGIIFLIVPLFSLVFDVTGITDEDPKFSAYDEDYWDISNFVEDIENYNCNVPGSIHYSGKGNNDGTYDYEVKSIVSTPTLLLGDLIDPEKTIYIAVGVERSYTQEEVRALRNFLARGGHAIIADDYGYANQIANDYGVTFFGGQFYDESFDTNVNYTQVQAHMGSDLYDVDGVKVWSKDFPYGDGVWDDDQDADGKIDEDDHTGSSRNYDDDRDNADLQKNLRDDDNDGIVDEENEGFDEDPIDDDVVFTPGGDAGNRWYGHLNVDLEWLNGIDDDGDDIIDEDLQSYELITYKPTGLSSSVNPWIWAAGTSKSFIDMDGNGILSIPTTGDLKGKNADEVSSVGNEIQFCVEIPVSDDGTGAVDVISGESMETIKEAEKQAKKFRVRELNPEADKLITELGSVVFIADPSIFMNDLYSLNHIRYDVNLPWDPEGNGEDDDGDGLIDEDREILRETGDVSQKDIDDRNNLADNSPDYWSESDVEKYPWLSEDMIGKPKLDYDNHQFLLDLIHHLCPAKEGETNLILIDESRHSQPNHLLKPVYKTMEVTGFLTSSPYYAFPIILSIGFLMIFAALLVKDKESWAHNFDISTLVPRKAVPVDNRLQTTKLRLAMREKVRLSRGLSPEEFASINESTILGSIRDPELIELLQNTDRTYTAQELQRMMEKIKKIQNI